MTKLKKITFVLLLLSMSAAVFAQEAKNALLIANGNYVTAALKQPIPEAKALKTALESIGFNVMFVDNADKRKMEKALKNFKSKTEKEGGIAFFHYGGHAVQIDNTNYLVPILEKEELDEDDIQYECVELSKVIGSIKGKTNIIILDSCRDDPFKSESSTRGIGTRGLAGISIPKTDKKTGSTTTIVYSATEGTKAQDGVFTPALTKYIVEKNRDFNDILVDVTKEVRENSNGNQEPRLYSPPVKIYLAGRTVSTVSAKGSLHITSEISGTIYVEGEQKGIIKAGGSLDLKELQTGSYNIVLEPDSGIGKFESSINISTDTSAVLEIKAAIVNITSVISGDLYINDIQYQKNIEAKKTITIKLFAGEYNFEIRNKSETIVTKKSVFTQQNNSLFIERTEREQDEKAVPLTTQIIDKSNKVKSNKRIPWYSIGLYGSYTLSHFTTGGNFISFTGHGFSLGIIPVQMLFGIFDIKLGAGYSFAYKSFGKEKLIYNELDALILKGGLRFGNFSFHAGTGIPLIWETVNHNSQSTSGLQFGLSVPIDIQYAINNIFSVYAEYNPTFLLNIQSALTKHSFNIGFTINILNRY